MEILGRPGDLGLRFDDARYAVAPSEVALWVVPADGVTCMFRATDMAAVCRPTAQAYRYGIVLQVYRVNRARGGRASSFAAVGIAPDGVPTVSAKVGARPTKIPVIANTYSVESRRRITILALGI